MVRVGPEGRAVKLGGRAILRGFVVTLAAGLVLALSLTLPDRAVRGAVRARFRDLDARYLGGSVRRLYHAGERRHIPEHVHPPSGDAYAWLGDAPFVPVAHALGPILFAGENSLGTLEQGWRMGFRIFEVDLAMTTDGDLVCYHGAESTGELADLSETAYLDTMRVRGIVPCHFRDLVDEAHRRPGIRFVLDVKTDFDHAYRLMRTEIRDTSLGKAFIPQVYAFDQLAGLRRDGFFAGEIFTSYRSVLSTEEIFTAARRLGVRVVTLTLARFDSVAGKLPGDLVVLTHSVDDPIRAAEIREAGARGIYTSYLTPATMPELFMPWSGTCAPPERLSCGPRPPAGAHVSAPRPPRSSSRYSP